MMSNAMELKMNELEQVAGGQNKANTPNAAGTGIPGSGDSVLPRPFDPILPKPFDPILPGPWKP